MQAKIFEIYDRINPELEEAFKVLRTNIQFFSADKKIKTITVVSCNPKEGKTTVAINLSILAARAGMKTLLVDADLRKPMPAKRLGGNSVGLSNYLHGDASLAEIICNTTIKNLYYIPCGIKMNNTSELIGSEAFSDFLRTIEGLYDIILIDSSTLGSVIDAAIIASHSDGTLVVVESRAVQVNKAKRLKEQLENANARILGVVLNKVGKRDYKTYSYNNNFHYYENINNVVKFDKNRYKQTTKNGVSM